MRSIRRIGIVAVIGLVIYFVWPTKTPPPLPIERVKSLDIEIHKFNGKEYTHTSSSSADVALIKALLQVIQVGKGTSDHKCADSCELSFQLESGPPLKVGGLAGHNLSYYEFRLYSTDGRNYDIFKVDRRKFLAAMAALGRTDLDLGSPE